MEPVQIAQRLKEKFPSDVVGMAEYRSQASVTVKRDNIVDIARWLHDEPDLSLDLLRDLCGVDYADSRDVRFAVVYQMYSVKHNHLLRVYAQVPADDPQIDTVTPVWEGANWHERECYDMFGITFKGHPDLRRILLPEDWEGHPLRKDYPAEGPEKEWAGYQALLEKSERLKEFEWNR